MASFLNGRNLWRLWLKNLPTSLLPELLPSILRYQLRRAGEALAAWRGAAARATLRGQVAGLRDAANHLAARGPIQARRRVSDAAIRALLTPAR